MASKFSSRLKQLSRNSDRDNVLSQSTFEYNIFGLMKIDIVSLIKTKASLSKSFHIQPSEIDKMPMWEFELYIKYLNELIEEENERNKNETDNKDIKKYKKMSDRMSDPNYMHRMTQSSMPKMPTMNLPKI